MKAIPSCYVILCVIVTTYWKGIDSFGRSNVYDQGYPLECHLGINRIGCDFRCKKYYNYSDSDIVALVLARGGSKGIHLKNLAKIGTDTLLGRTLKTIRQSQIFSDIWISTDHSAIDEEAQRYDVNVHIRPTHVADDNTTSIESIQEFLKFHPEVHNIALIQCTSVFLKKQYLEGAVQLFREAKVDCVFSVVRSFKLRWKFNQTTGHLTPLNFDPEHRPRRQDWDGELVETGMIYLASSSLLQSGVFQNKRCGYIEVDPEDAIEVDTPSQLSLANVIMEMRHIESEK